MSAWPLTETKLMKVTDDDKCKRMWEPFNYVKEIDK